MAAAAAAMFRRVRPAITSPRPSTQLSARPSPLAVVFLLIVSVAFRAAAAAAAAASISSFPHRPVELVRPAGTHTKLETVAEGIELLASLPGPVAPVAVVGPYRSGKSFLLNQLLGLPCDEGFGVGHMRDTKTKGMWLWGEPRSSTSDPAVSVMYIDTEGFESAGRAGAYDERVFALAAATASVLVYNLPEAVREADVARMALAVELAEEFHRRASIAQSSEDDVGGSEQHSELPVPAFRPATLVWLIQRDFLEGATVQEAVAAALAQVPNPTGDRDIERLNRVRRALSELGGNSTAFSLRQPHLDRTHLCDLEDSALDPEWRAGREKLKEIVASLAAKAPREQSGRTLARMIERTVAALNKGDIPTTGSVIDAFNREALERAVAQHKAAVRAINLPLGEVLLYQSHQAAAAAAMSRFLRERVGHSEEAVRLLDEVRARMDEEYANRKEANAHESARRCEALFMECEDALDKVAAARLPSTRRLEASFARCNTSYHTLCIGPAHDQYVARMDKMWSKERSRFLQGYNQRISDGLVVLSLACALAARFILRVGFLELLAWAAFAALELSPRFALVTNQSEPYYDSLPWRVVVGVWEAAVFNPVLDLDRHGVVLLWGAAIVYVGVRFRRVWVRCVGWRANRNRKDRAKQLPQGGRDLEV